MLWEKYRSLSPYHYCANNPIVLKDPSGFGPGGTIIEYERKHLPEGYAGGMMVGGGVSGMALARGIAALFTQTVLSWTGLNSSSDADEKTQEETKADDGDETQSDNDSDDSDSDDDSSSNDNNEKDKGERNWKQDKQLSKGEVKKLQDKGVDVHELKGGKSTGKLDLYKDRNGRIYVKPKGGKGAGEDTGLNVNDY